MDNEKKNDTNDKPIIINRKKIIKEKINKIEKKILQFKKEKKVIKLRYYADIDNLTKKNKKEIQLIKHNKFKNFLKSITSIIDKIYNLVKISINSNSTENTVTEGIRLTFNILEKNLKTWHVKIINKVNIPFDPNIHVMTINKEINEHKNNKIVKKIKKNGYIFKKEIIKKAIVTII
ncbi:Protein GrpE [Buchnera aphidicola (Cinara cuneomaculata)]|uniref:Protein GrpE n=1 Tax=Buchnera aphidicola (Cinara cuneomaculata) TaxID=1660040 RepID=A0A451CXR2_9GAMM|nr:Protein GrpE [Buchnera aphidicola (Cinara cuneomaculata)]